MKQYIEKHVHIIVLILVFLFCMAGAQALAADATMVEVNGVTLSAASPYWKNGGGGSASDWNVFFDTSTSAPTLILKDAVIDTMNANDIMIYANGDLVLELLGSSTLSYVGSTESSVGIVVDGDLIIKDGTGSIVISLENTGPSSLAMGIAVEGDLIIIDGTGSIDIMVTAFVAFGIYNAGNITVESRSIDIMVTASLAYGISNEGSITVESGSADITAIASFIAFGLNVSENLYIHGGRTTIQVNGLAASAISAELFNLTGGSITATTMGEEPDTHALIFIEVLVTGGFGKFVSDGNGFGAIWEMPAAGNFRVLDGQLIFSGREEALYFATDQTFVPYVTDRILVSANNSGSGKFVWDSSKGLLAGNDLVSTSFRYVELLGSGILYPQTGDSGRLWLWLGIGMVALLGAGALLLRYIKRK